MDKRGLSMPPENRLTWHPWVTGYQLQVEMEQMTETTRNPDMLWECWSALGNDLQLIAEALVRQTLAERLLHNWYVFDARYHGRLKKCAMKRIEGERSVINEKNIFIYHGRFVCCLA